jgi:Domain of unknown function (DUF4129)
VRRPGRLVAALVSALALAAPATAAAEEVSGTELIALGQAAATDGAARERLLAVDAVDGRPVDVRAALAAARGRDFAVRTRAIAALVATARRGSSAAADRRRASAVLDDRRYKGADLPRPLQKPLEWIGDRIKPVFDWINSRGDSVPGGPVALWLALSALIVAATSTITGTTIRRRALAIERARAAALPEADDPHALERAADRAEHEGHYERAVRLRFRAGLLRLDRRHVLVYRPSLTTGDVARAIEAPAFAEVGARFDEIAYGGRPAERADAEAAKAGWKDVLAQAAPS